MDGSDEGLKVIEKLQAMLAHPQEDLDTEFKGWLNLSEEDEKANLAQAILALANHGGGHVIIGFTQSPATLCPDVNRPVDLSCYSSDNVNNVVKRYAEPRFQCRVAFVKHPIVGDEFPVITVPGGHKIPIRAKSETQTRKHVRVNAYYIRRPGPESSEPQTSLEWDDLIKRCLMNSKDDLLGHIRHILQGFGPEAVEASVEQAENGHFVEWVERGRQRFKEWGTEPLESRTLSSALTNYWIGAYAIHEASRDIPLKELLRLLREVERDEPGGSYWHVPSSDQENEPWPLEQTLEAGMKPLQTDWHQKLFPFRFWRASPQGLMSLLQGYEEDFNPDYKETVKRLRAENPIWDAAACCLHAARLARALAAESSNITVGFAWEGLKNRKLVAVKERKYKERICHQQSASSKVKCSVSDIDANLPEIVRDLTRDLYEGFSLFEPTMKFIEEHISDLKRLTPGISRPHL